MAETQRARRRASGDAVGETSSCSRSAGPGWSTRSPGARARARSSSATGSSRPSTWLEGAEADGIGPDGVVVAPGFLDLHVHLREPGNEDAETVASGLAAAAHGGFTTVCAMPNTTPAADEPGVFARVRAAAGGVGLAGASCSSTARSRSGGRASAWRPSASWPTPARSASRTTARR